MTVQLISIANGQQIEVGITSGPGNANLMRINTGTAVFDFKGKDQNLSHDTLTFPVGPVLPQGSFQKAIAVAAPARLRNDGVANNALWAVNEVRTSFDGSRVLVSADFSIRDIDGRLERMAFQVTTCLRI